jgi:hypothetical protein
MGMKFFIEETRWHGCKYYAVGIENDGQWGMVTHIIKWTEEAFGEPGDVWSDRTERYYMNSGKFIFRNESDVTMFVMRWS